MIQLQLPVTLQLQISSPASVVRSVRRVVFLRDVLFWKFFESVVQIQWLNRVFRLTRKMICEKMACQAVW